MSKGAVRILRQKHQSTQTGIDCADAVKGNDCSARQVFWQRTYFVHFSV